MPVKIARSAARPSFGLPELLVAIHTSRQSCYKAGKARIFTPVRESSGESRLRTGPAVLLPLRIVTKRGLHLMERTTKFAAFAVFAFLVGSSSAIAEQSNGTAPRLDAPRGQAPASVIKPIQENRIPKQTRSVPAPGNVGAGQGTPQAPTERPPLKGVEHMPSSAVQQGRPRAVYREVARRINIAGDILVLPVVVYYGVPVILNVPELGLCGCARGRICSPLRQIVIVGSRASARSHLIVT